MKVKVSDRERGVLELEGPALPARLVGGAAAVFGAGFTARTLPFLRLPIPFPFKLIPLTMAAVGSGLTLAGAIAASAACSVHIERKKGLTFRWHLRPFAPRERQVSPADMADFEVTRHEYTSSSNDSFPTSRSRAVYRLVLVTKAGEALPFEEFATRAQAMLRQEAIAEVLGPVPRTRTAGRKRGVGGS
jgi:hypothetical protein